MKVKISKYKGNCYGGIRTVKVKVSKDDIRNCDITIAEVLYPLLKKFYDNDFRKGKDEHVDYTKREEDFRVMLETFDRIRQGEGIREEEIKKNLQFFIDNYNSFWV